jgi:CHAD domain-containing protein
MATSTESKRRGTARGGGNGRGASPADGRPSEFTPPPIAPDDPTAVAVQVAIASGYHRLRANEPAARAGEVEGVHRLRTATRRLRSDLRTVGDLLDADRLEDLEAELKWLGERLGAVRDLDVLRARLESSAGDDAAALGPLFEALDRRHAEASTALREALCSDRYGRLTARLAEAADSPPLSDDAWEPCRDALPPLAEATWRKLRKSARRLCPDSPDDDFHEARKRAKRARYAAEAVAVALDPRAAKAASRFAKRATDVQDVLGEHQDATVACAEIWRAATSHPHGGPFNFAAGRLLERQAAAALDSRQKFFKVWDRFDRPRYRRWLKG